MLVCAMSVSTDLMVCSFHFWLGPGKQGLPVWSWEAHAPECRWHPTFAFKACSQSFPFVLNSCEPKALLCWGRRLLKENPCMPSFVRSRSRLSPHIVLRALRLQETFVLTLKHTLNKSRVPNHAKPCFAILQWIFESEVLLATSRAPGFQRPSVRIYPRRSAQISS